MGPHLVLGPTGVGRIGGRERREKHVLQRPPVGCQ
jgi:hypothetical protein